MSKMKRKELERPGPRDILFSCYSTDLHSFDHIANRRFRKYLDVHIQEFVACTNDNEKRALVRQLTDPLLKADYRFLKLGKEGIFVELGCEEMLKRVGNCLRDYSINLNKQKIFQNLKTREQLTKENTSVVKYAESMAGGNERKGEMDYWVRPRGYKEENMKCGVVGDMAAMKGSQIRNNKTVAAAAAAAIAIDNNNKKNSNTNNNITNLTNSCININKQLQTKKLQRTIKHTMLPKRHFKSLDSIVISSMQQGMLPIGGNWKFFPLPELQNKVNLGTDLNGWQLKLEPISMAGDPIILDVPL